MFLGLLLSSSAWSQPAASDSMPPWTVLVLKLVSATHVQPTTGIVIAAPDLVLIAADFARAGDEIMVLDGGTDIVRHGRPASIVHTLPADKLVILKVQGLNRPAAQLSAVSLASLQALKLVGFPPAEEIAQGAAPVRATVKTLAAITTAWPTLDPFPNVSAALTDDCGGLVAFNLPSGVQSMQPAGSPRLAWPDALKRAAELTGTAMQPLDCSAAPLPVEEPVAAETTTPEAVEVPDPEPKTETAAEPKVEPETIEPEAPQPDTLAADQLAEPVIEPVGSEAEAELPDDPVVAEHAATEVNDSGQGSGEGSSEVSGAAHGLSTTAWFIAGLVLVLLLGWWWRRRRQKPASNSTAQSTNLPVEPGTVRFTLTGPGPAGVGLKVTGQKPDGNNFSEQLPVSGPGWMAELGRQEADLDLGSPTVSRRHARLELHEGRVIITDLDSTNGTRVNGVSCLPGEVFFVQADDVVELGDVKLNLQLTTGEDQ